MVDTKICEDCITKLGTTQLSINKTKTKKAQSKYIPENIKKVIVALRRDGKRTYKSLCEEYGVSYASIKKWEHEYWDDDTISVTIQSNKIQVDEDTDWKKIIERKDLTEEFIIENHKNLLVYTDTEYESNLEYTKRQARIPFIKIFLSSNYNFELRSNSLLNSLWNEYVLDESGLKLYPLYKSYLEGRLRFEYFESLPLDRKKLSKYGIKITESTNKLELVVNNPTKIPCFDNRRWVKHGVKNLDYVLKNNNLFYKKYQSEEFTQWLTDNGYRKK